MIKNVRILFVLELTTDARQDNEHNTEEYFEYFNHTAIVK